MEYTEVNFTVIPKQPAVDILIAELSEWGFESFVETDPGVSAFIPANNFKIGQLEKLNILNNPDFKIIYNVINIPAENWNATWESNFDPIEVENKCLIRAPFHKSDPKYDTELIILPKMSFGTGHHETTWLMVNAACLIEYKNKHVLDMGCGTGILAILAKIKGAAKVLAVDIDEWACENSAENAKLNNVEIDISQGDADILKNLEFDVIFANINRNILIKDIAKYTAVLKKDGELLLSGFFETDVDRILAEAGKNKLYLKNKNTRNHWAILHLKK